MQALAKAIAWEGKGRGHSCHTVLWSAAVILPHSITGYSGGLPRAPAQGARRATRNGCPFRPHDIVITSSIGCRCYRLIGQTQKLANGATHASLLRPAFRILLALLPPPYHHPVLAGCFGLRQRSSRKAQHGIGIAAMLGRCGYSDRDRYRKRPELRAFDHALAQPFG